MTHTGEKNMFKNITDNTIDGIQNGRKLLVDVFIKNENLAKSIKDYIDVETTYTKEAVNNTYNSAIGVSKLLIDKNFYVDTFNTVKDSFSSTSKKAK